VIRLSAEKARRRVWPPVDPLTSRSRLLEEPTSSAEHAELVARVRDTLAVLNDAGQAAADPHTLARAEKLQRFFGQPFFAAERYTRRPGAVVGLAESLRVCRQILDGVHDDVPAEAFFFKGGLDEIRERGPGAP
jgi:F-type H+-transporting ATPase subunit beta